MANFVRVTCGRCGLPFAIRQKDEDGQAKCPGCGNGEWSEEVHLKLDSMPIASVSQVSFSKGTAEQIPIPEIRSKLDTTTIEPPRLDPGPSPTTGISMEDAESRIEVDPREDGRRDEERHGPSDVELEARRRMLEPRDRIAWTIQRAFLPLLILTISCVLMLGGVIVAGMRSGDTITTVAFASSVQVVFGMVTGYVCVYIGLMMTWFGIEAAYSFGGTAAGGGGHADLSLKSASPGLLFALGGMVVIAASLYKPIVVEESGNRLTHTAPVEDAKEGAKSDGPEPKLLPPDFPVGERSVR